MCKMRVLNYIVFLICFLSINAVAQQKQTPSDQKLITVKHAKKLTYDESKVNAKILIGEVVCEHEGAVLSCDTAYIYDDKRMKARGHISIVKGDSIFVTGNKLDYESTTKLAVLEGSVRCIEKDMVLTTEYLTFDVAKSVASYYTGGKIVNKENTLTSKNGYYYSATKDLAFHGDVELVNPEYKMKSDTLRYNTTSKIAYFFGPSIITSKDDYIYCENGWYDTEKEKSQFSKHALLVTKNQKLRGDSLFYDRKLKYGKAFNNVQLIDTSQKSILYGNYIEYYQKSSKALATKQAVFARILDGDTLFLGADTLYHQDIDSTNNFLKAHHHVRIFKKDLQAICDSATYNTKDSLMQLFRFPFLWSQNSQASAKLIKVFISDSAIKGFRLENNAFLINRVDTTNMYSQVSGKSIEGFMVKDTIRKAVVTNNSEIYYYVKNKGKIMALNKTQCENVQIYFKAGDVYKASFLQKPTSTITPIKEVNVAEIRLKGFNWQPNKKPQSAKDLHVKK
jgi:lipopolysaccharide assembly outer membrane protein LptD (OstA)